MSMVSSIFTRGLGKEKTRFSNNQQKVAALIFGVLVILAIGFAPMEIAHNAAHDTRHSFVFPCH